MPVLPIKLAAKDLAGIAPLSSGDSLGRPLCDDATAVDAAFILQAKIGLGLDPSISNIAAVVIAAGALFAFLREAQKPVTGEVTLNLYKGNIQVAGRMSPNSLYDEGIATMEGGGDYNQTDAEGFINLFGLPLKVQAMLALEGSEATDYAQLDYTAFKRD